MSSESGDFSLALSILRISRGWSQDQLAKAAGLTNSALSEYERGRKMPELRSLRKIVTALGYRLSAIERTEDFLRELKAESLFEAPQGEGPEGPVGDAALAMVPPLLLERLDPQAGATPLRVRARRVAAQVGLAATGFCLLLFEILLGRDRER
jgi:transcriptional regulator with XRE-family HTH domain